MWTACSVGPDYEAPDIQTPAALGFETGPPTPLPPTWWALLEDPLMEELMQRALTNNHDLKIAQARLREARAGRQAAASTNYPTVGASGFAGRQRQSQNSPNIPPLPPGTPFEAESDLFRTGFDAAWEIDVFGGTRRSIEGADARSEAASARLNEVVRTILAEIALNYVELRGIQERQRTTLKNINIQEDTRAFVENRFQSGLGTELELAQALAQLRTTQAALPGLEAGIRARIYQISTLVGDSPGAWLDTLSAYQPLPDIPTAITRDIPSEVLRRRPDVQGAERTLAAETADIGAAIADFFPKFSLTGGLALESGESSSLFESASQTWSFGPGISWALFQGGRIRANVDAQEAQAEAALAQYEKVVLSVFQEVETVIVEHNRERETSLRLESALNETSRSVELSRVLYEEGLTDFLSVLDAEGRLTLVEDQYTQSKTREWTSLIRLYKALGGGWEV